MTNSCKIKHFIFWFPYIFNLSKSTLNLKWWIISLLPLSYQFLWRYCSFLIVILGNLVSDCTPLAWLKFIFIISNHLTNKPLQFLHIMNLNPIHPVLFPIELSSDGCGFGNWSYQSVNIALWSLALKVSCSLLMQKNATPHLESENS